MEQDLVHRVKIDRNLYEQNQLNKDFNYEEPKRNFASELFSRCKSCKPSQCLKKTIPILEWLPNYKWRRDIMGDLISGFTVAIMHIPQGMAYSLLGNVPAVIGIYMAFFPVIVYSILGTSRHISMGTFAIVCLMVGSQVLEYSDPSYFADDSSTKTALRSDDSKGYTPIQVASTASFVVALIQLGMYIFQLGVISALLSEPLVSGFTTASAVQVLTSQVKDLFGLHIPKHKGNFVVPNIWISVFKQIGETNLASLTISAICIIVVVINNEVLKPRVAKLCSFPIPIELIAVVVGVLVSDLCELEKTYNVSVVGDIPSGLPPPELPQFELIGSLIISSIPIAIVSYAIAQSLALIFAQKEGYEVDGNQELLAHGAGNMVGSFFSCMPYTTSMSRSIIQLNVGGKTQLTSLISCAILFLILMWIGPLFEPLPKSILASVIVVALKGMFIQVFDVPKFFRLSILDGLVWVITFAVVVFISIDIGLFVGLGASLACILIMGFKPYTCLLGASSTPDIYLDIDRYKTSTELSGCKIYHYRGGIDFASKGIFKSELFKLIQLQPQKEITARRKLEKYQKLCTTKGDQEKYKQKLAKIKTNTDLQYVVLDFSAITYIDPSGAGAIKLIGEDFRKLDIPIAIAGCCGPAYEMLLKCEVVDNKNCFIKIYPTIHDAVRSTASSFLPNICNSVSVISS